MDENRDYRSEVGKKIEEALELGDFDVIEDLIEVPPMETFMKWAEQGEEKRKKRVRRRTILASCAAVLIFVISAIVAIQCINPPEVEAGPEGRIGIDITDMESITTYETWSDLPEDVKEQFIEVKNLPDGYVIEKIEVGTYDYAAKINVIIRDNDKEIEIRQLLRADGGLPTSIVDRNNESVIIGGLEVYIEKKEQVKTTTYKYSIANIVIDVIVPSGINEDIIESIIKTVQ